MRNVFKVIGVIAITVLIIFTITTCRNSSAGGADGANNPGWVGIPVITITAQPVKETIVKPGKIKSSLKVKAEVTNGATLYHQWYRNTENNNIGGEILEGKIDASFAIPTTLEIGKHYYFCKIDATGEAATVTSNVATVTVTEDPIITIITQPDETTTVIFGNIIGKLSVMASVTEGAALSFQWYRNTIESNAGGTAITGDNFAVFTIPTTLEKGKYFYFCEISADGETTPIRSNVATVTVTAPIGIEAIDNKPFMMGYDGSAGANPEEKPSHEVTFTRELSIGKTMVTQEQYQAIMGINPSSFTTAPGGENSAKLPVESVSWYDAIVFCNKLSIIEGLAPVYIKNGKTNPAEWGEVPNNSNHPDIIKWEKVEANWNANGYRLPTEAEWEYACRAGTTTSFNTGAAISNDTGWYTDNSGKRTHEVAQKQPNKWGLYDMHGNVYEWCWDWYDENYYKTSPSKDPTGPDSGTRRVVRGGSWDNDQNVLRSAYRDNGNPLDRNKFIGFRVVRTK